MRSSPTLVCALSGVVGALLATTSCGHPAPPARADAGSGHAGKSRPDAGPGPSGAGDVPIAIERAEENRRPQDIQDTWLLSADRGVRRRAMRALARVVEAPIDAAADAALLRGLGDEDRQVAGWAAYGLGWACKGKEDAHVNALAARAATLADADAGSAPSRAAGEIDPLGALVRSIGRCGGGLAEGALTGILRATSGDSDTEETAYALGALAGRRALGDEAIGALLDRASGDPARPATLAALFPLGRLDHVPEPWTARVIRAARATLAHASSTSPTAGLAGFAVRALEKTGILAVSDLASAAARADLPVPARTDAARALGRLGVPGREAAGGALARMLLDRTLLEPAALASDRFHVLLATVDALGQDAPKSADPALRSLASLPLSAAKGSPALTLRTVALRCAAAGALVRAAYDADVLAKCDPDQGVAGERARLAALVRKPLVAERRKAFRALAESPHVAVREEALEAIAQHPELDEAGRALLVQALAATEPGVVAAAAQAIVQHPERVLAIAASERRAALDPRAPPPSAHPAMDLPAEVSTALGRALAHPWREDAVETRTALLDAAVAVSSPDALATATRACSDPNVTVREHGARALRNLGAPPQACPLPAPRKDAPARPEKPPLARKTRVLFDVSGTKLVVDFEPELTPIAARRFVELARGGFYKGIVVHRVVPGYVVQFGDPGGDGYGGSGELLPCETSPVPFDALDVGVALAGRDTGSSQIFVTLARYPKLDGEYARVGVAEGDWGAVAQGDVIDGVTVEE